MAARTRLPRVHVLQHTYVSLAKMARSYRRMLVGLHAHAPTLEQADVVMLHLDLRGIATLLERMPSLRRQRLVGYIVWEADRLPRGAQAVLAKLDAVWTASWYSARALLPHHPHVRWLPHAIEPLPSHHAPESAALIETLGPRTGCVLVVAGRLDDRRKNAFALEHAVRTLATRCPGLRLVRKHGPLPGQTAPMVVDRCGPIDELYGHFNDAQMAALYRYGHYVASAHHGEAWGLTLSEGLSVGRPAIAPAYSGNLAFMHAQNSLLVPCAEQTIAARHSYRHASDPLKCFEAPMRWGVMLPQALEAAITQAYQQLGTPAYGAMARAGEATARRYSANRVKAPLAALLRDLPA